MTHHCVNRRLVMWCYNFIRVLGIIFWIVYFFVRLILCFSVDVHWFIIVYLWLWRCGLMDWIC